MCVEEKFVSGKNIPALQAVGWEGLWGGLMLSCALVGMYYLPRIPGLSNCPTNKMEDSYDAILQISRNPVLAAAMAGNILSIAFLCV